MSLFFVFVVSFLYALPFYDKSWAPFDEGFILEASYMITKGLLPYRDFFLVLYPPGQAYTLAALFKIFGTSIIVGRIYTIFMLAVISASVFYIMKNTAAKLRYTVISFILCLTALAPNAQAIPRPMWSGIAFSLLAVIFAVKFIKKEKAYLLTVSGLFTALTILFRHDIGVITFAAVAVGLLSYSAYILQDKELSWAEALRLAAKFLFIYSALPAAFTGAVILWLYKEGALADAYASLILFPGTFAITSSIPLPQFCPDFNMIFHRGCLFIKSNMYFIPIIISAVTAIFILCAIIVKRRLNKAFVILIMLFTLSLLYLEQVMVRADPCHLAAAFVPATVLFGLLFVYTEEWQNLFLRILKIVTLSFISLLMALYFYKNVELYYRDIIVKPYIKKEMKKIEFKQGAIYVPDDGRRDLLFLVDYVGSNTARDEKIYLGSLRHMAPQYGWNELIYFLAERLPAVKYYELHPGLQDKAAIQEKMVLSLEKNNTRLLLLRNFGDTNESGPLDEYIRKNFRMEKSTPMYDIYLRRKGGR